MLVVFYECLVLRTQVFAKFDLLGFKLIGVSIIA